MLATAMQTQNFNTPSASSSHELAEEIVRLLQRHANYLTSSAINSPGACRLRQVQGFIESRQPIEMVILGFPAKSPNRQKTFSEHADMGEVEGLRTLNQLCKKISQIYPPGARVNICSDGHIFADLVHVSDANIDRFQKEIEKIIAQFDFDTLSTFSARTVYPRLNGNALRTQMVKDFAQELTEIRKECQATEDGRGLFNGIHRFLFEDDLVLFPELSRSQARERSKQRAYSVIQRSQAFSRLVAAHFPDAVRLSIHPHTATSEKLGIQLVPSDNRWATPWHNVLVMTEGGPRLMPRLQAESLGAKLNFFENQFAFFEMRK